MQITATGNPTMMLTTQQAAERLNVHPETIRRLVKAGKLKAVALSQTGRARLRIDEKELQAFIDGSTAPNVLERAQV
jgi:excisionase family DNA binding protein